MDIKTRLKMFGLERVGEPVTVHMKPPANPSSDTVCVVTSVARPDTMLARLREQLGKTTENNLDASERLQKMESEDNADHHAMAGLKKTLVELVRAEMAVARQVDLLEEHPFNRVQ